METTTHNHGMMTTTTTADPHAGHTTADPHAGHTTADPHAGHTTANPHDGHDMMMGMMMEMHGGIKETIVFSGWKTTEIGSFIGSCFALMIISMAYEGLKLVRDRITHSRLVRRRQIISMMRRQDSDKSKEFTIEERMRQLTYMEKISSAEHIIQTLLHILQFAISYFIMLAVMTYNYWLCLSILIGIGIGFFFFGVRRDKIDLNEDCH